MAVHSENHFGPSACAVGVLNNMAPLSDTSVFATLEHSNSWTSLQVACSHLCHLCWASGTIVLNVTEKHGLWSEAVLGLNSCFATYYLGEPGLIA